METNSLVVFNAWKKHSFQLSYVASIIKDCISFSSNFISFTLLLTLRRENLAAELGRGSCAERL